VAAGALVIPISSKPGDVCVQRGEVLYEIRVATRYQPITGNNTFGLDLGNSANARCLQGFYGPFVEFR
jgi:hypothetical protein